MILEMCTVITDPPAGEPLRALEPTRVARTRHVGPYEEIGLAEHAVRAFAEEQGYEATGTIREIYRNDPAEVPAQGLVTDVLLPISPPSARTPRTAAARR